MPYINLAIDVNQVMIMTFDALVAPDSTARIARYFVDNVDSARWDF